MLHFVSELAIINRDLSKCIVSDQSQGRGGGQAQAAMVTNHRAEVVPNHGVETEANNRAEIVASHRVETMANHKAEIVISHRIASHWTEKYQSQCRKDY